MSDVTVVIPAYNHAPFLGAAIESALASDVAVDVIVVDDGSSDSTAQVARTFGSVRYVHQDNAGAAAAINAGIALAQTDVVAILNDDDLYEPHHLSSSLLRMRQCGASLCLSTPSLIGSGPLRAAMEEHLAVGRSLVAVHGRSATLLAHNWFVSTSALVMTRQLWSELEGFRDLRLCHDLDFALRALTSGAVVTYLEQPSWRYRCHGANTVSTLRDDVREAELSAVLAEVAHIELPSALAAIGYGAVTAAARGEGCRCT